MLTDCDLLIPTIRGFESLPGDTFAAVATYSSSVIVSAISATLLDGSFRLLAGTAGSASAATSSMIELTSGSTLNRDGAGGPYTASSAARWTFAQYGSAILAAQKGTQIIFSDTSSATGSATFTAISGAPQAVAIVSVLNFIVAFNTIDVLFGDSPNRWWNCATGNFQSWVPNVATQATSGLLTDINGAIVGGAAVGSDLVAFSADKAVQGRYVGAPSVWDWKVIAGEGLGAYSHHSIVSVEGVGLLWPGQDNFYLFDGARATPIGTNRVAAFFQEDLNISTAGRIVGFHEQAKWRVFWWYPSIAGGLTDGALDRFICFNYRSRSWGFGRKTVGFPLETKAVGLTWDDVGDTYTTWDDLPSAPYDSAFMPSGSPTPSFFSSAGAVVNMNGVGSTSYFTTGGLGTDARISTFSRARPRFQKVPTSGTLEHSYADQLGIAWAVSQATEAVLTRGAFDRTHAARWHQLKPTFVGDMELVGLDIELKPESLE